MVPNQDTDDERESTRLQCREAVLLSLANPEFLEEIDPVEAASALPQELRAVLDTLGSPQECAKWILTESERRAEAAAGRWNMLNRIVYKAPRGGAPGSGAMGPATGNRGEHHREMFTRGPGVARQGHCSRRY